MRILHLVRALDVGGLESIVLSLINRTKDKGIESHLGCLFYPGEWQQKARVKGTWIGDVENRSKAASVISLCRYLRKNNIDLIHSHNPQPHFFGTIASILTGIPIVHTKHGRNYPDNPRRVWLNRQLSRFTKRIIAVSENAARVAIEIEKVPAEKVVVIRNGIDVGNWKFACPSRDKRSSESARETGNWKLEKERPRKKCGIPHDAFVIGSVGRFSAEKNYELLIRAFARLVNGGKSEQLNNSTTKQLCRTSTPPYPHTPILLLVGDGPERSKINSLIGESGIRERVIMPGMQEDVLPWLRCMDVFCLSSLSEGTSITLLEAGACGLPAVVTDVGGNREVVEDGITGVVVPSKDEEAIAGALVKLAEGAGLREKMGIAARRKIESDYSVDRMIQKYVEIYSIILHQKK